MRARKLLAGLKGEEDGMTLVELLVAMSVMLLVLGGVYGLLQTTSNTLVAGGMEEENAQQARAALEQMDREIRYAYPQGAARRVLTEAKATRVAFANDLNSDGALTAEEAIVYEEEGGSLYRTQNGKRSEVLDVSAANGVVFSYIGDYPAPIDEAGLVALALPNGEDEQYIQQVQVKVTMGEPGSETRLENTMDLANRR